MPKPDVPKRLASKIRAAQYAVTDARNSILHDQQRSQQSKARLDEYNADPDAFAARYYRNVAGGKDSYPVTTTIQREQEQLNYRTRRLPERIASLSALDQHLTDVEAAVLSEVTAMTMTSGRVPWPRPLPSLAAHDRRWWAGYERERIADERRWERERIAEAEADRLEDEAIERESARMDAVYREEDRVRRLTQTPAEIALEKGQAREMVEALKRGDFTVADVISHLQAHNRAKRQSRV